MDGWGVTSIQLQLRFLRKLQKKKILLYVYVNLVVAASHADPVSDRSQKTNNSFPSKTPLINAFIIILFRLEFSSCDADAHVRVRDGPGSSWHRFLFFTVSCGFREHVKLDVSRDEQVINQRETCVLPDVCLLLLLLAMCVIKCREVFHKIVVSYQIIRLPNH